MSSPSAFTSSNLRHLSMKKGKAVFDAHCNCSVSEKAILNVLRVKGPKVVQKTPTLSERTVKALGPLVDSSEVSKMKSQMNIYNTYNTVQGSRCSNDIQSPIQPAGIRCRQRMGCGFEDCECHCCLLDWKLHRGCGKGGA